MKLSNFLIFLINLGTCWKGNGIKTYFGDIIGHDITVLGEKMTEYLGIPYAQSPTEFYRFKPPFELEKDRFIGNNTFHASHEAVACPQNIRTMGFDGYDASNPKTYNESCLRLNMWVPKGETNMPVIVFFHGGSWTVRTGSADKFNGSVLALKTKSIVVVPNFRLGFFGFAYLSGEDGIEGNMGLLDQQMVLKWINRTIESFGGDKTKVTIFGTSSGASAVAAHLFSNNSRLLFKRGIMSSGTITHFMTTVSREIADTNTRNVSVKVGCIENINDKSKSNTQILDCLRNKTVEELLNATRHVSAPGQMPTPFPFMPINNDTVFFNGSINEIYKKKEFNTDVDLMLGRTADEATFFMATGFTNNSMFGCYFYPQKPANDSANKCEMSNTNFENLVKFGGKILKFNETEIEKLQKIYEKSANSYTNRSIRILSDFIFDCELSRFAITFAGASTGSTYFYEYNRRSPINLWPEWTGAMHGDDLIDIFGIPFRHSDKYDKNILEREKVNSEHVMWAIGNFTKEGNIPNVWNKLNVSDPKALEFNGELGQPGTTVQYKNVTPSTCTEFYNLFQESMLYKMSLLKSTTTLTPTTTSIL
ncbi:Acetylcholinesterase [Strongyloides ratti]|uniref:Carboxylic ester hydrolase n=1 Tax=Strongyloides ratti TaxID=34506 RepID=A0A090N0U6_STRRB|nr:Acetylcholinesterase [Strongyloides ratti]CEF71303.1 Acetylcholinesterase [Strongyloides ratti]